MFPPIIYLDMFFKVQVHVEDDPERIYKTTEVGITSSFVNQNNHDFIHTLISK